MDGLHENRPPSSLEDFEVRICPTFSKNSIKRLSMEKKSLNRIPRNSHATVVNIRARVRRRPITQSTLATRHSRCGKFQGRSSGK